MVEVKVSELSGAALDWAVDVATADLFDLHPDRSERIIGQILCGEFSPSTNWAQGGPLIEKYNVSVNCDSTEADIDSEWRWGAALDYHPNSSPEHWEEGKTALIAACRAIVASKFGDTVSVPAELVECAQ